MPRRTHRHCLSAAPRLFPINGGRDLLERLDDVERRLLALAETPPRTGQTQADAETGERWHENQVWGHLAEFPGYWVGQIEQILVASSRGVPPFGRTTADADRLAAIDAGNREPRAALVLRATNGIADARAFLARLDPASWSRIGRHPKRGDMDVAAIVERFLVDHLDEHALQLESLAAIDR
jgi:hypothetical protein